MCVVLVIWWVCAWWNVLCRLRPYKSRGTSIIGWVGGVAIALLSIGPTRSQCIVVCVRVRECLNFVSQLCSAARLSHSVSVNVHRFSRHTFKATNGAGHSWKRSKFVENLRGLFNCCA